MSMFRSYWYYWYTGNKRVALVSMLLTALLVAVGMVFVTGLSLWGVVMAVLMDLAGFWLVLMYVLVLRHSLPLLLVERADTLVLHEFVIPLCASVVLGRLVTWCVARYFAVGRKLPDKPRR